MSSHCLPRGAVVATAILVVSACAADDPDDMAPTLGNQTEPVFTAPAAPTTGDGPTDETATPPEVDLDDDWTLAEADDFSIGIPPEWFDAHRALEDDDVMAEVARRANIAIDDPTLADLMVELARDADVLAYKISDLTSEAPTHFVIVTTPPVPLDVMEADRQRASRELASAGYVNIVTDEYEVDGIPSLEVRYERPPQPDLGISVETSATQTAIYGNDDHITAAYTAVEPDHELWLSVLDTMVIAN